MLLYIFTWPTFDIIGRYTQYVALFKKVTWKPIPHESKVTIDDIHESGKVKETANMRWLPVKINSWQTRNMW